jgi:hypothetical protein
MHTCGCRAICFERRCQIKAALFHLGAHDLDIRDLGATKIRPSQQKLLQSAYGSIVSLTWAFAEIPTILPSIDRRETSRLIPIRNDKGNNHVQKATSISFEKL